MNVLVACEESQEVCKAFRKRGHNAFSCDLIEPSGGHPEWHIQGDALLLLPERERERERESITFRTMDGTEHTVDRWDILIAHPNCQHLTVAANRWYNVEKYGQQAIERLQKRQEAIDFFLSFAESSISHIAVENPVGIMSTVYRKPDQIIQPYEYGHHARKKTCLWLKNLPLLQPTNIVDPGEIMEGGYSVGAHADGRDENGKWLRFGDPKLAKLRSKTYTGIAEAMASQWSDVE